MKISANGIQLNYEATGPADAPIVFTSSKEAGTRARGDWGGVIINGNASVHGCEAAPCEAFGEGGTGYYGGDNDADDSGVLSYVRVEFAGTLVSPDNELNGIAFQGVGSATDIPALVAGTLPQHRVTKLSPIPAGEHELTRLLKKDSNWKI